MAEPSWVLFDADGVVQRTRPGWLEELTALGGDRGQEFVLAVFAAEQRCVAGGDFGAELDRVLADFDGPRPWSTALPADLWIAPDPEVLAAVRALRARGVRCGLATNQSNLRGEYMRTLYGDDFDATFYSYELGAAKPDPAFFAAVLERLGVPADGVLFLDDAERNVTGARAAGLRAELVPSEGGVVAVAPLLSRHGLSLT